MPHTAAAPASRRPMPAEHDRPRERLLALGSAALADAELIAILLGTGRAGESALGLAESLLREFGGVRGIASASVDVLARRPGIGVVKAARLVAAFTLADRADRPASGTVISASCDIAAIATRMIGRERTERLLLVVADGGNRVTGLFVVAQGDQSGCLVPVRQVLAEVLRRDGAAFGLAHNHPSGRTEPSTADVEATNRLRTGADAAGLRMLDHVIVAGRGWRSITASR